MSLLFYRILKWTLLSAIAIALVLGILFSVFVMNPFEGTVESIDALMPADVNVYAAKSVADEAEQGLFATPFWQKLSATEAFKRWVASPEWRRSGAYAGLREALAQLNLVENAFRIDPIAEVAGREVAVGTRFPRSATAAPDFLAATRLSFKARAAFAMLQNDTLRSFASAPVETTDDARVLALSVRNGARTDRYYLGRDRDVLLVGSAPELVTSALNLAADAPGAQSIVDRLGPRPTDPGSPIGLLVSPDPGRHNAAWSRTLVPPGVDAMERLLRRAADPAGLVRATGTVHLGASPRVALDADFRAGSLRRLQRALVEAPTDDAQSAMRPFLRAAPRELMAFVFANVRPRDIGAMLEDSLAPDMTKLIADTLRPTEIGSLSNLLDRWTTSLERGCAILFNRQTFAEAPTNPPHPGVSLVFRMTDLALWERTIHHDLLEKLKKDIDIRGVDGPESPRSDVEMLFYRWGALPMPDVMNPCFGRFGNLLVFSTSPPFLRAMADAYIDPTYALGESKEIRRLFEDARPVDANASLFAFVDVRRTLQWVDDMTPYWARAQSLQRQLDQAGAKRKALEYQARGNRSLATERERERWIDDEMDRWYERLEGEIARRKAAELGPIVEHAGVLHTVGLTIAPGEAPDGHRRLRLRATLRFDP